MVIFISCWISTSFLRKKSIPIRFLHFEFWSGRYNTNIQKFWPKNPSRYQYDRKNVEKFFNPIPIRESFLGQKSTRYQYNIKKIFFEDQYNTNTIKNGNFWTILQYFSIFWRYFGHFLSFFGQKWAFLGQKWAFFEKKNFSKIWSRTI